MNLKDIKNKYIIITGEKNSGKTTFLINLISYFIANNLDFGGIVTVKQMDDNDPASYHVVDLSNQKKELLCSTKTSKTMIKTGKYYFSETGISFGNEIITKAIFDKKGYIIIDEAGPLELRGEGWDRTLSLLDDCNSRFIITVRKSLLHKILDKYAIKDYYIHEIQ